MNKSFVKFVTDFGPLVVFFFFYYNSDKNLKIAIPPFIIATLIALIIVWILEKKIPMVPLIGGILISLFGGLTIYFDNPIFIYIKPTIINILFGLALLFGKYFTKEPVLKKIMGKSILLTDKGWELLGNRWMLFFFGLAIGIAQETETIKQDQGNEDETQRKFCETKESPDKSNAHFAGTLLNGWKFNGTEGIFEKQG